MRKSVSLLGLGSGVVVAMALAGCEQPGAGEPAHTKDGIGPRGVARQAVMLPANVAADMTTALTPTPCTGHTKLDDCFVMHGSLVVLPQVQPFISELAFLINGPVDGILSASFPGAGTPNFGTVAPGIPGLLGCYEYDQPAPVGPLAFSCEMTGAGCNQLFHYQFGSDYTPGGGIDYSATNATQSHFAIYTAPCAPAAADPGVPTETTAAPTLIVARGALPQTVRLEYGPTTAYGQSGSVALAAPASTPAATVPAANAGSETVFGALSGLSCATTYHYRFSVTTDDASFNGSTTAFGADETFTTAPCTLTAQGQACTVDAQCGTGHCADGVCCDSACGNSSASDCQACNRPGSLGTCTPFAAAEHHVCRSAAHVFDVAEVCDGSNVSCPPDAFDFPPPVLIQASGASAPPRGRQTFHASGGVPPYSFSFASNPSRASISSSGQYIAGPTGSVRDVIRITDSAGNYATAGIDVTASLAASPAAPQIAPRGALTFRATGGSKSGISWAIAKNGSGGTIDPTTGAYKAGGHGSTVDTIEVRDSLSNTAQVNVSIGGALAIPAAAPRTFPRGFVQLEAVGGSRAYTWTLSDNGSGGSIQSETGAYTAGPKGDTVDVVLVKDTLGSEFSVEIGISSGLSFTNHRPYVSPNTKLALGAAGGSGNGFAFTLERASAGSMLSPEGFFSAGGEAGLNEIRVVDSAGNEARATVEVASVAKQPASAPAPVDMATPAATSTSGTGGSGGCAAAPRSTTSSGGLLGLAIALSSLVFRRRRAARSKAC